jgi:hypothetical protein
VELSVDLRSASGFEFEQFNWGDHRNAYKCGRTYKRDFQGDGRAEHNGHGDTADDDCYDPTIIDRPYRMPNRYSISELQWMFVFDCGGRNCPSCIFDSLSNVKRLSTGGNYGRPLNRRFRRHVLWWG